MATIQNRAEHLKRGDMLADGRIVTNVYVAGGLVVVHSIGARETTMYCNEHATGELLEVEKPDLTPAQQNAEEMAERLREAESLAEETCQGQDRENECWAVLARIRATLDKIKPPEPPTLAETLAALAALSSVQQAESAADAAAESLLDRARRSGVLK